MLKQRLLTLLILFPLVLLAIWFLPQQWFSLFVAIVMMLGAWEWSALSGVKNCAARWIYILFIILGLYIIYYYISLFWLLTLSFIIWLWIIAATCSYAVGLSPLGFQYPVIKLIIGFFVLIACSISIMALREKLGGPSWLLFGFLIIWMVDIGGYVFGRLWGKHLLISRVSPKKTWEGFAGGIICALFIPISYVFILHLPLTQLFALCFIVLVTAIFATFGDLFESMLKRQAAVKDSGQLLPGHGGVLDRIDSMLAALPIFALSSLLIQMLEFVFYFR